MPDCEFTVTVQPRYLRDESLPSHQIFSFAYTVTILNTGRKTAQLLSRHWIIHDAIGTTEEVRGDGVVGEQPTLRPGEAFEYTSGCRLKSGTGTMHGSYFALADDGTRFEVQIPVFLLHADDAAPRVLH